MNTRITWLGLMLVWGLSGCATPPIPPDSDKGASVDLVVKGMVESMVKSLKPKADGQTPVIGKGPVVNTTAYHVETNLIWDKIVIGVLNSGKARFSVATDPEREGGVSGDLYKQLEFQNESGLVNPGTVKAYGKVVGADYVLFGRVYDLRRGGAGQVLTRFRYIMTLYEVETALVVWSEEQAISGAP